MDEEVLSTDQFYLFKICQAVESGEYSANLKNCSPGKMGHARWLTTANRILRLYVGSPQPSENLIAMVTIIMRVYAPMWFIIKKESSIIHGSKHLCSTIVKTRYLPLSLRTIVDKVIQRNAFFGHQENILLAMVTDVQPHIRELGIRRILKAREERRAHETEVRVLKVPQLNFEAKSVLKLINWTTTQR